MRALPRSSRRAIIRDAESLQESFVLSSAPDSAISYRVTERRLRRGEEAEAARMLAYARRASLATIPRVTRPGDRNDVYAGGVKTRRDCSTRVTV